MTSRIAITIFVLLLLPVVAGPILIGVLIERGVEQVRAHPDASAIEIEFDRGLYTSRARTVLTLEGEAGGAFELAADHVIVHGPVPLAAPAIARSPIDIVIALVRTTLDADAIAPQGVADALDGAALVTLQTRITSTGDVDVDIESPAFELDTGRLIWAGLSGTVTLRDSGRELVGEIGSPGLRLADDQVSLTVQDVQFAFDADLDAQRIQATLDQAGTEWTVGDRHFETGALTIEADQPLGGELLGESQSNWRVARFSGQGALGEPDFDLTAIEIRQAVLRDAESGLHTVRVGLSFEGWQLDDEPVDGPGGMTILMDRLDRDGIQQFRSALQALEDGGGTPEEVEAMRPFVALEQLPGVLASSPVFDVRDAFYVGPEGRLEGAFHITVDGSNSELLGDPFMLMNELEAAVKLNGPEPLVRRMVGRFEPEPVMPGDPLDGPPSGIDARSNPGDPLDGPPSGIDATADPAVPPMPIDRVDAWIADGTLVREGERLELEARFENGFPMLNGEPADPSFLMNLVPGM